MTANPILLILDTMLVFFAPGAALLLATFPGKKMATAHGWAYFLFFAVVSSAAITIVMGAVLGFAPTGAGLFTGLATGSPNIELGLALVTLALMVAAGGRGAFKSGLTAPRNAPAVITVRPPPENTKNLQALHVARYKLKRAVRQPTETAPKPGGEAELDQLEREIVSLEGKPD